MDHSPSSTKRVFVTVGTTSFDDLIDHVLDPEVLDLLENSGYNHLTLQIGRGVEPKLETEKPGRIQVSWYRHKDNIACDIQGASLVISHAGAGSCLEVLGAGKPLVVVVNPNLMGNHQTELADKLQSDRHVLTCYPQTLAVTLQKMSTTRLLPFPPGNSHAFPTFIKNLMGLA